MTGRVAKSSFLRWSGSTSVTAAIVCRREAEAEMVSSLRQFGQLSPVVCRWQEETPSLIDGFRRLHAARQIAGLGGLTTRLIEIDDREAKVAMYRLNLVGRRVHVLEEAWLVYALVREDGLSQLEVAQLMGRHKSWVCRRLALLEKLAPRCGRTCNWGCCRRRPPGR